MSHTEVRIDEYLNDSYDIFIERLNEFRRSKHRFNTNKEKELRFMLEALIDSRSLLHNKDGYSITEESRSN